MGSFLNAVRGFAKIGFTAFQEPFFQQFTYGVVSEGVLWKVCRNSAESSRTFVQNTVYWQLLHLISELLILDTAKIQCLPLGPFCGAYVACSSPREEPSGTRYCLRASVGPQNFKGKKGAVPGMEALLGLNRA